MCKFTQRKVENLLYEHSALNQVSYLCNRRELPYGKHWAGPIHPARIKIRYLRRYE